MELLAKASSVDLHAGLTLILQLGNDPSSTERRITFSMFQVDSVGGACIDGKIMAFSSSKRRFG